MTVMVEGEVEPLRTGCFTGFALTGSPGTFWISESRERLCAALSCSPRLRFSCQCATRRRTALSVQVKREERVWEIRA